MGTNLKYFDDIPDGEMDYLKQSLLACSLNRSKSVAECLAELVRECLLSDDDSPIHVNGLGFVKLCDDVLMRKVN